jgi:hypothetical protein
MEVFIHKFHALSRFSLLVFTGIVGTSGDSKATQSAGHQLQGLARLNRELIWFMLNASQAETQQLETLKGPG